MIKFVRCKSENEVAVVAADVVENVVKANPATVLGLATGSSPVGMYSELGKRCDAGKVSFKSVKSVNLDEYVGLGVESDQSYVYFMRKNFFSKIDIDLDNTNLPNGLAEDLALECKRYDALIDSLCGVDIQVLGIGNNGHIGFNEPADNFPKSTSVIELTDSTIEANSRFFASRDLVPTKALSMGIGQIMAAKNIVMIALGSGKADILEKAFFGPVTPEVPASILQFYQGNITVVGDEAAMAEIAKKHGETVFA